MSNDPKMVYNTLPPKDGHKNKIWDSYRIYAPDMIILDIRSEVKVSVTKNKMVRDSSPPQDASTHQI